MQRILFEEAKAGQLNLSMYERVRRRRQKDTQSDENKKNQALEMLRENKKVIDCGHFLNKNLFFLIKQKHIFV